MLSHGQRLVNSMGLSHFSATALASVESGPAHTARPGKRSIVALSCMYRACAFGTWGKPHFWNRWSQVPLTPCTAMPTMFHSI